MFYAKSNPEQSITEHTNELLDNLKKLKETYKDTINKIIKIDQSRFWYLLEIICKYHDIGKVYTPFQNIIRQKLKLEPIKTKFNYDAVKHEQLSPIFIPVEKLGLSKEEKKLVYQAIYYHHERKEERVEPQHIKEIIEEDILPKLEEIKNQLGIELEENLTTNYLKKVGEGKRITPKDTIYPEYCLLKGLLHRLDHSSSAGLIVEDQTKEEIQSYVHEFMKGKKYNLNELQEFAQKNTEENVLVIGSTGMGKTEAALLWSKKDKTFFTLPIRISINAIYDRINSDINYHHVGLLHSTAIDYLEEKQEIENEEEIYEQSKNLTQKITTCTIDQIFPFVFKYRGYEKIYATLSYSKIIIDEIQAYSPEIVAIILKGLEMIHQIGGKFMVMTATLPRIYREELQKRGIKVQYGEFLKPTQRHWINLQEKSIKEDINQIIEKGKKHKVLIITNTINQSIEIQQKLKEKGIKANVLHSRFTQLDRNNKENKIKEFSQTESEPGIWITTQIVEASLDIDFDYLFTEMSTLDSLFQRLGRCYRSREYKRDTPNIWIYEKEATGIGSVYDEEIHQKSIALLKKYNNQILEEQAKIDLVDELYSEEQLKNTKFYQKFQQSITFLDTIIDYDTSKKEAQKLLRNIDNITIIPKTIYDKNLELFNQYEKEKDLKTRNELRRKINQLTISINQSQKWKIQDRLTICPYLKELWIADLKYDNEIGLLLKKDEEYELDERFAD
jgi:CRISPR-associated endonuclease/helicase Cas3